MRSVVIIPARYKSTRFPGKPLVKLLDKEMILWVAELSTNAVGQANVYVATEDSRIFNVVEAAGFQAVMTSDTAATGTDRLAEAAEKIDAEIFINVQGDEPLLDPDDILKIIDVKKRNMSSVVNGYCWISGIESPDSVNIPKVVTNESNRLLYMSRKSIPGFKSIEKVPEKYKKQVCIYAFTIDELRMYKSFGRKSEVEAYEDIEILRFFEFDKEILMVETSGGSLAVDIKDDIGPVEKALKAKS